MSKRRCMKPEPQLFYKRRTHYSGSAECSTRLNGQVETSSCIDQGETKMPVVLNSGCLFSIKIHQAYSIRRVFINILKSNAAIGMSSVVTVVYDYRLSKTKKDSATERCVRKACARSRMLYWQMDFGRVQWMTSYEYPVYRETFLKVEQIQTRPGILVTLLLFYELFLADRGYIKWCKQLFANAVLCQTNGIVKPKTGIEKKCSHKQIIQLLAMFFARVKISRHCIRI